MAIIKENLHFISLRMTGELATNVNKGIKNESAN